LIAFHDATFEVFTAVKIRVEL